MTISFEGGYAETVWRTTFEEVIWTLIPSADDAGAGAVFSVSFAFFLDSFTSGAAGSVEASDGAVGLVGAFFCFLEGAGASTVSAA